MALSTSPRKVVPLAGGDGWHPASKPKLTGPTFTKRVFYCGVVVENSENGRRLPQDVQDLITSLGEPLAPPHPDSSLLTSPVDTHPDSGQEHDRRRARAMTDSSALADVVNELVSTERSYVTRLHILKHDYADPLRKFSRNKETAILQPYEAKTLFGNIDNLLPVNEAFLADLERMATPDGPHTVGGIGDVALRHFRDLRGFEQYKGYYDKREEAQSIFLREIVKKSSGFAAFIDRIKYSNADARNRVGLRELLMDPVQRIPRYTLMFRTMIKHMAPGDPQRKKLVQADEIASKIALAEADEQTKQAAIWYCLSATVDGFPPGLISNSRRFIDCIDVEDVILEQATSSSSSTSVSSAGSLHCTLFLFDDKLVIAKRPGNGEKSGRTLSGLDEMEKLAKAGGLPLGMKKSGMTFKGVTDVTDVVAADVGGADIHFYLENPPEGQSDRWSGRSFRALSVVHPPAPVNLDPTRTEADKSRFLENLWNAQATYRTRVGQSVVLCAEETEVESRGGRVTLARTYFNVYQRTAFLQENKKTKIVVHIDSLGSADPVPFGVNGPPFVRIRVQPIAGDLCRYSVMSRDPDDESEDDIVQSARVPARIIQTIHQFGLFKFRTGNTSVPSTPTSSVRSRAHIFGLDAISRNLFNTRPTSSKGDFFGGSINSHRRSKTSASRSSTITQTTTTADGSLMKFSSRSNSTATAATTISAMDDESSFWGSGKSSSRSRTRTRKLIKRGKSPGGSGSDPERASPRRAESISSPDERANSWERELEYSDVEDTDGTIQQHMRDMDESDMDLSMRLELARKNSQSQHGQQPAAITLEKPVEDTIYEEEPPQPTRPAPRASRDVASRRSTTPTPRPITPSRDRDSSHNSRPASQHSSERRPVGPRSPSPLPPKSPLLLPSEMQDADLTLDKTLVNMTRPSTPNLESVMSPFRRSNHQPIIPIGIINTTPKPSANGAVPPSIEPLSIKKKTSLRVGTHGSPIPARKPFNSPLSRASSRIASPRRVSSQVRHMRTAGTAHHSGKTTDVDRIARLAQTTKEDVESSSRAVKRIRLELDGFQSSVSSGGSDEWRPSSPLKSIPRAPPRPPALTREAQERLNEMRQLIGKRYEAEGTPRSKLGALPGSPALRSSDSFPAEGIARSLQELVSEADRDLSRAISNHGTLQDDLKSLAADFREKSSDLEKTRVELQNAKRQCELVKSLLADATAEKEIMYEAFNEELDEMYNDANLPEDEAWTSMTQDLRQTKEARNALTKENSQLKRRLAEVESQQEEWGALLRAHGLIP